jgi:hypothetical protein
MRLVLKSSRPGVSIDGSEDQTQCLQDVGPARHILRFEELRMEGDFYRPSKYRGSPSPAIDSAWDDLWMGGYQPM